MRFFTPIPSDFTVDRESIVCIPFQCFCGLFVPHSVDSVEPVRNVSVKGFCRPHFVVFFVGSFDVVGSFSVMTRPKRSVLEIKSSF